jgi:hypothetical protein
MLEHLTEHCDQSCTHTHTASVPAICSECSDFSQLIVFQEETLVNDFLQIMLAILHDY